jgi:integrase
MKRTDLPRGVFAKGRWFYLVTAQGKRRIWQAMSLIRDGLPALYTALAAARASASGVDKVPALIAQWERDVMPAHAPKTQKDERARGKVIAAAFVEFDPGQVETPDCSEFLQQFAGKPRTFNAYRAQLREYMRFAEEKGRRPAGSNPLQAIKTKATPARDRCPTTSELRRVKVGCLYGDDGKRTRSGITMACLIELAYLSGQDVGVMIRVLEKRDPQQPDEPHVTPDGVWFRRDKTGNAVEIGWTPRLRAVVARLRVLKAERNLKRLAAHRVDTPFVFTKQDGTPLTYEAVSNAWQRGVRRAKVAPVMFRDIRARALTDKEEAEGIRAANAMGAHSTESQTADYVRRKAARKTGATR